MDIYTIGHTNQSQDEFLDMLKAFDVNCIIDVRSMPYSQHASQFNQEILNNFLNQNRILYAHFGLEFGARRNDCLKETVQKDGSTAVQVNFELGVKTDKFKSGINRLDKALSQGRHIALMCTESNPLDCHRFSFISRFLVDNGYEVGHIMRDKSTKDIISRSHNELEKEMIDSYLHKKKSELRKTEKQLQSEGGFLFPDFSDCCTEEEQRNDAYRLKNREIGYIPSQPQNDIMD